MEILVTIAYIFLIRLVFFDYRWIPWNLATGIMVFGLYTAAALTEIVLLGQYAPYSGKVFVERPVIQMATYLGGQVKEIYVKPNEPISKGSPLYKMDPAPTQARLDEAQANSKKALQELKDTQQLVARKVMAAEALKMVQDDADAAQAEVDKYQFQLEQTVAYAPADGYVINMQLRPGQFARLKAPVMSFVSSEEAWLVMAIRQEGSQYIEPGLEVEFALTMYPGEVFTAQVTALIHGVGEAQLSLGGLIPPVASIREIERFAVKVLLDEDQLGKPMIFGASGLAAINTGRGADVFWLLRRIEIQSESLLNYIYNPFGG
jgi:multidrug resistance efflux pump